MGDVMELKKDIGPIRLSGTFNCEITDQKKLKIIVGEDAVLNEKVPAGKKWITNIRIDITEE